MIVPFAHLGTHRTTASGRTARQRFAMVTIGLATLLGGTASPAAACSWDCLLRPTHEYFYATDVFIGHWYVAAPPAPGQRIETHRMKVDHRWKGRSVDVLTFPSQSMSFSAMPTTVYGYELVFARCDASGQCTDGFGNCGNGDSFRGADALATGIAATWRMIGTAWLLENLVGLWAVAVTVALMLWLGRRRAHGITPRWVKWLATSPMVVVPALAVALTAVWGPCERPREEDGAVPNGLERQQDIAVEVSIPRRSLGSDGARHDWSGVLDADGLTHPGHAVSPSRRSSIARRTGDGNAPRPGMVGAQVPTTALTSKSGRSP